MQQRDNESSRSFEWFGCGADDGAPPSGGAGRSIRPGTAVPATVLVSEMGDGYLLLKGWRTGRVRT